MSISGFEILSKIGEGAYSTVFKVRRISDGKIYALKKVSIEKLSEKEKNNSLNEIRILASIKDPNVISYKEAFFEEDDKSLCLVMEFADSGDLHQRILRCRKRSVRLNENFIWSILIQVTQGLKALHDFGIFHRDLKSANVFLNKDGTVKLGDMNVSKVSKDGFLKTQTGTPYYASPEVWQDMKYTNKSDIWSLGCVIYEAITLRPPFNADDMEGLFQKVMDGNFDPVPKVYSRELSELVAMMLVDNPEERPSCQDILDLDIVRGKVKRQNIQKSESLLLRPIKMPDDLSLISGCLPLPDYQEANDENAGNRSGRLPQIRMHSPQFRLNLHKSIENSNNRLKRIKDVYLSPIKIYHSPQSRPNRKYVGLKSSRDVHGDEHY
jgi:NIMA (never in mitosis gene a)-related kinase